MLLGYAVMCLIFGTTFLMIKIGLQDGMPPFLFAGLRFFIAGALILLMIYWRKSAKILPMRVYVEIAAIGWLMTSIPFAALFWAQQYIASGLAALLVATAPIFTTILSVYSNS
jgi:drug/metabolite transporter (DMT)-like permease